MSAVDLNLMSSLKFRQGSNGIENLLSAYFLVLDRRNLIFLNLKNKHHDKVHPVKFFQKNSSMVPSLTTTHAITVRHWPMTTLGIFKNKIVTPSRENLSLRP